MKISNSFVALFILIWWVSGAVLAKGFWSTLSCIYFPPWAFYLVIEKLMIMNSII